MTTLKPTNPERITFNTCPPGLFRYKGLVYMKTDRGDVFDHRGYRAWSFDKDTMVVPLTVLED